MRGCTDAKYNGPRKAVHACGAGLSACIPVPELALPLLGPMLPHLPSALPIALPCPELFSPTMPADSRTSNPAAMRTLHTATAPTHQRPRMATAPGAQTLGQLCLHNCRHRCCHHPNPRAACVPGKSTAAWASCSGRAWGSCGSSGPAACAWSSSTSTWQPGTRSSRPCKHAGMAPQVLRTVPWRLPVRLPPSRP